MKQAYPRNDIVSRRTLLRSIGTAIAAPQAVTQADRQLISLGQVFDFVSAGLDCCIEQRLYIPDELIGRLGPILSETEQLEATTLEGLYVKARVAAWDLLGDFVPSPASSLGQRITLTIVRDLIRQHRPSLEHPYALEQLMKND